MMHTAFSVPDGTPATSEGCDWVDQLAYGDVADNISRAQWGFGVGNMRTDVVQLFATDAVDSKFLKAQYGSGNVVGGSWSSDVWYPSTWASHAAIASHLTEDGEHLVDSDGWPLELRSAPDVLASETPLPGRYQVRTVTLFDAAFLGR